MIMTVAGQRRTCTELSLNRSDRPCSPMAAPHWNRLMRYQATMLLCWVNISFLTGLGLRIRSGDISILFSIFFATLFGTPAAKLSKIVVIGIYLCQSLGVFTNCRPHVKRSRPSAPIRCTGSDRFVLLSELGEGHQKLTVTIDFAITTSKVRDEPDQVKAPDATEF